MPIKITLELSEEDLSYYRSVMDDVWKKNRKRAEKELVDGARRLLKQATKAKAPEYVQSRLADLEILCSMLDDSEWPLEDDDRGRIIAAVGYFAVPKDLIPDKIPGIGFLDDAIMAELVLRELKPELEGYRAFCEYRDNEAKPRGKQGQPQGVACCQEPPDLDAHQAAPAGAKAARLDRRSDESDPALSVIGVVARRSAVARSANQLEQRFRDRIRPMRGQIVPGTFDDAARDEVRESPLIAGGILRGSSAEARGPGREHDRGDIDRAAARRAVARSRGSAARPARSRGGDGRSGRRSRRNPGCRTKARNARKPRRCIATAATTCPTGSG